MRAGPSGAGRLRGGTLRAMNAIRPLLVAVALALPALAGAQWQWLDKDGRSVFSDRPPPPEIPPSRILKQPAGRAPASSDEAPAGDASAAPALPVPKAPAGVDPELEARKKQQEAAEEAKRKEEQAKLAQLRADNCQRARAAKANLESGVRIARTNAKGEREFLDDKQRAEELKRVEGVIARDCQ